MIKAVIIDDELHSIEILSILVAKYCPEVEIVEKCNSAIKGLQAIKSLNPGLLFLDIEMPIMTGFELLEQVPEITFAVIFTTSYDQYAIRAIRFSALDYLLKPINPKELIAAVQKAISQNKTPSADQLKLLADQLYHRTNGFTQIAIPTIEGFAMIPALTIVRCEANNNYTHIMLKNGNTTIACRTLKEIEEQLSDFDYFLRVHNSYLVNLNEVSKYVRGEGGYLVMSDNSIVNVSRTRKDALLKKIIG